MLGDFMVVLWCDIHYTDQAFHTIIPQVLRWRVTKINDIHDFTLHCYFREKTVPSGCFCR